MYKCDKCGEELFNNDSVMFLADGNVVYDEENSDITICCMCYSGLTNEIKLADNQEK